jgi:hypothetical protein
MTGKLRPGPGLASPHHTRPRPAQSRQPAAPGLVGSDDQRRPAAPSTVVRVITPDTKNWTWSLTRACPESGFDASTCRADEVAGLVRENARSWERLLRQGAIKPGRPDESTCGGTGYGSPSGPATISNWSAGRVLYAGGRSSEALVGGTVGPPAEIAVKYLGECGFVGGSPHEQGRGRSQLLRIDRPEDLFCAPGLDFRKDSRALHEPRAEHRMAQVGSGLFQ